MKNQEQITRQAAEIAAREAARVAIEMWEKEKKKEVRNRVDRRLRNTKLLMDNYRSFVAHVRYAVFDSQSAYEESAIYILDMMDSSDGVDSVAIESIKRSTARTAVIVSHIDEMLKVYKLMCESSRKPEDLRRFRIISALYIDNDQLSILDIADAEHVDQRTVYRDRDIAFERLSALFFGIDGMERRR